MSAFLVSKPVLDRLVSFAAHHGILGAADPAKSFQVLLRANLKSLRARYGYNEKASASLRASDWTFELVDDVEAQPADQTRAALLQLAKDIACLSYQSCEANDWFRSSAKRLLDDIGSEVLASLARSLDGYNEATWG